MLCIFCKKEIPSTRNSNAIYCSNSCGQKMRQRRYYKNNPEYFKAKRLKENSKVNHRIYTRIKSRAKLIDIPFNLEVEDIVIPETCPVLGLKLEVASGHKMYKDTSPSVDRIIPEKGYTKGNIRVISQRANHLKSNASVEELEKVLADLRRIFS